VSPSDRTERGRLQATLGELADVQPYHYRVEDIAHPELGWWASPNVTPLEACNCGLCEAARDGRDVHLGSISRVAHVRAGALVARHLDVAA
jgi:hypothetical protein